MAKNKTMILRVQSPDGTQRVDIAGTESVAVLLKMVKEQFQLPDVGWSLYVDRTKKQSLGSSSRQSVEANNLKHGDMLYLSYENQGNSSAVASIQSDASSSSSLNSKTAQGDQLEAVAPLPPLVVLEEPVDVYLAGLDGKIERKKDPKLCRHGSHSKCVHCSSVDPFDEEYLHQSDVKHMSFQAYLRKLTVGKGRGSNMSLLENISCKVKPCSGHAPWPAGICTKCQPDPVTLNRQRYRFVDNISIENPKIVERFLGYWRQSGNQRAGLLFGRYDPHLDVPLGVKAVVVAIYEPPQTSTPNSVEFLDDPNEGHIQMLASALGLKRIGWIFTDLVAAGNGTVRCTRGGDNHFLSAEECITAGWLQSKHPNPCKAARDGHFGSKFVTVICTGDKENQVHFEGYQVSDQCTALVRDECLLPTYDAPELAWVRESTSTQYVPDVCFKEIDQYGNEVSKLGRPLPVEYLIVDVPTGVPVEPQYTIGFLPSPSDKPFPIANRMEIGELQNFDTLTAYCKQFTPNQFPEMVSDFHFLLYLLHNDTYSIPIAHLAPLLERLKEHDRIGAFDWSKNECFATLQRMVDVHEPGAGSLGSSSGASDGGEQWECAHCTFHNRATRGDCEMCGLPKK